MHASQATEQQYVDGIPSTYSVAGGCGRCTARLVACLSCTWRNGMMLACRYTWFRGGWYGIASVDHRDTTCTAGSYGQCRWEGLAGRCRLRLRLQEVERKKDGSTRCMRFFFSGGYKRSRRGTDAKDGNESHEDVLDR